MREMIETAQRVEDQNDSRRVRPVKDERGRALAVCAKRIKREDECCTDRSSAAAVPMKGVGCQERVRGGRRRRGGKV